MASRLPDWRRFISLALPAAAIIMLAGGCSGAGGGGTGNDNTAANDNAGGGNDNEGSGGNANLNENANGNDNVNDNGNANANANANGNGNGNSNDNSPGGNANDNASPPPALEVIDTGLDAHVQSPVAASERLLAWVSDESGSSVPRAFDLQTGEDHDITAAVALTDDFAVSGSDVIVRGTDLGVYHFDAANPQVGAVRVSSAIILQRIDFGRMNTDGGSIVAFITQLPTWVCWVDLNDPTLFIRTFGIPAQNFNYFHVAVDGTRIAAVDGDSSIEVRDTAAAGPDYGLQEFPVTADLSWPLAFRDGYILYAASEPSGSVLHIIDTATGQDRATDIVVAGGFHTRGGTFCAFRNNGAADVREGTFTSVVGDAASGDYEAAPRLDTPGRADAGWGASCAVADGGGLVFTAGVDQPTGLLTDLLTRIEGGRLVEFAGSFTPADPGDPMLVAGSNIITAPGVAALLLYTQTEDAHLGYIRLGQ